MGINKTDLQFVLEREKKVSRHTCAVGAVLAAVSVDLVV